MIDCSCTKVVSVPVAEPATVNVVLRLLQAEQSELEAAVDSRRCHLILDGITDVIYRAKELALAACLTLKMLPPLRPVQGSATGRFPKRQGAWTVHRVRCH